MVVGIVFFLVVIVGRAVYISHYTATRAPWNRSFPDEIRAEPSGGWIFSGWFKQSDGFERLEQSSDGENELATSEV